MEWKTKVRLFPLRSDGFHPLPHAWDWPQFSRTTVRSWSSSFMLMVAMAPSLNSNDVPPSITMQASQHRERTQTLLAKPLCRLFEKTLLTIGSLTLYRRCLSSGANTSDSLYLSVTFSINSGFNGIFKNAWDFPIFKTSSTACSSSLLMLYDQALDPVPVQMLSPELFCFSHGPLSTDIS